MRSEVGRLTRNIVIQGTQDDQDNHGGHLLIHGLCSAGVYVHIDGAEFIRMGQGKMR